MADKNEFQSASKITTNVLMKLSEEEAQAMIALTGYGLDKFLEVFYKHLGQHYLKPHEKGLKSLFAKARKELPQHIYAIEEARKLLKDKFKDNKQIIL